AARGARRPLGRVTPAGRAGPPHALRPVVRHTLVGRRRPIPVRHDCRCDSAMLSCATSTAMRPSGARPPAGLSFFFPAYNDAGTIASLVIQAVQVASRLTPDFEVLVINDGSQDATGTIAEE